MKSIFSFSLYLPLLAVIFWQVHALQKIESIEDCFLKVPHRAISGRLKPVAIFYNVSPFECLKNCLSPELEDRCLVVVYHNHFSTCQFYDDDGNNSKMGSVVMAAGHDYYNRRIFEGICGNSHRSPSISQKPFEEKSSFAPFSRRLHGSRTYRPNNTTAGDRSVKLPDVVQPKMSAEGSQRENALNENVPKIETSSFYNKNISKNKTKKIENTVS